MWARTCTVGLTGAVTKESDPNALEIHKKLSKKKNKILKQPILSTIDLYKIGAETKRIYLGAFTKE